MSRQYSSPTFHPLSLSPPFPVTLSISLPSAWEYKGDHAFLHGNINLQYTLPWILLGLIVEVTWSPLIVPLGEAVTHPAMSNAD